MAEARMKAVIKERYRATPEEHDRFGGDIVTEFYVTRLDLDETRLFTGYGATPGERKRFALNSAAKFWGLAEGGSQNKESNFFVWKVDSEEGTLLEPDAPQGPFGWRQAKDLARASAHQGEHDRVVTEGNDPERFRVRRRYQARTGAILAHL